MLDSIAAHGLSAEWLWGIFVFSIGGFYYGAKSDDAPLGKGLLIGLASNLMSFTVFGCVLTFFWLVLLPFGILVRVQLFGWAMLWFVSIQLIAYSIPYFTLKLFR